MKESEILERLIFRAFVTYEEFVRIENDPTFSEFIAAMKMYASAVLKEAAPACTDACPVEYPAPPAGSDPDTQQEPEPSDTHTHTPPGPMPAKPERLPTSPVTEQARSGRSTPN